MRTIYKICPWIFVFPACCSLAGCGLHFNFGPTYKPVAPSPNTVTNIQNGSVSQAPEERPRTWKLLSGKTITVLSVTTRKYPTGPDARQLVYRTTLPVLGSPKLKVEVNEVWKSFQKEVDKLGMTAATITAQEAVPTGPNGGTYRHTYVWIRGSNKQWRELPPITK